MSVFKIIIQANGLVILMITNLSVDEHFFVVVGRNGM
jgi:hypothetical protein